MGDRRGSAAPRRSPPPQPITETATQDARIGGAASGHPPWGLSSPVGLWGTRVMLGAGEGWGPRVSATVSASSRACSWRDHQALKAPQ